METTINNGGDSLTKGHLTFKDKLLENEDSINFSFDHSSSFSIPMDIHEEQPTATPTNKENVPSILIPISLEDRQRIYHP